MKKVIGLTFLFILFAVKCVMAEGFMQAGEYYHYYYDDGSIAYDQIIEVNMAKYYVNEYGNVVFNSWVNKDSNFYYAGNDGAFYVSGKHKVLDNTYYFDSTGAMQKGWINDMYYANEDGFLVNGFQELEIPKNWSTEYSKEYEGWFYFDTVTFKKYCSEDDAYTTKTIGTSKYCFDQNGIIRTGWRQIKETTPAMKGYMYFSEETTDKFNYGEAVANTWYAVEPPVDVVPNADVRYFYFNGQGVPRTAPAGKYVKARIDEKTFLFNEYGYAVYGLKKVDNEFYYFGDNVRDCSMKTGVFNKDLEGNGDSGNSFYFEEDGKGFTGVYNNRLYYKGKLQKATKDEKYAAFNVGGMPRLVNASGYVMKSKNKIKDGDECLWSTNSGGVVTYTDEGSVQDAVAPEENSDN